MKRKVTHGYVEQIFDEDGECISQSFTAGDPIEWLDGEDNEIDCPNDGWYQPYDMIKLARISKGD